MKVTSEKNIIIAGVGGQGNILISKIIAEAARVQGMHAIVGEIFGSSQRGGSVASHVRVGDGLLGPICPERGAEIICGLEPMESLRVAIRYGQPDGIVFTNTRVHQPMLVNIGKEKYPPLERILTALQSICSIVKAFDATTLAVQAGGALCTNLVLLGAVSAVIQDPAAAAVVDYAGKGLDGPVVDLCAAPGGKTVGLAAANPAARPFVAADVSVFRLGRLRDTVKRVGTGVHVVRMDGRSPAIKQARTVLLDAPCTGTGVLRRRPDAICT